ncbi:MAG TPA: DUF6510 family protein [Solirubrobacteraceae bacterium]|nr:DUF6510 family protein [Solirubrobacteraceae bacterium]
MSAERMEPLDGNAIAGALDAMFDAEMTTATGACRTCGHEAQVATLRVYVRAPGAVARCPRCGNVVFVLVEIRGQTRLHADGFELLS